MTNSWLASKEEIEKAIALTANHRQMVQAKLAKMHRTNPPAIQEPLFGTQEQRQQASKENTRHRDYLKKQVVKMLLANSSQTIHQGRHPAKDYTSKKAGKPPKFHPARTPC